jgi:lipopolysaccharide export LptBFGC system permease protein LptF
MESCWRCGGPIDAADRYCRHCGQGQGSLLAWYYRPFWIAVLALTALGPFALPLVWRTPRLDRTGKVIASVIVIALTAWVGWELVIGVREVGRVLDDL